MLPIPQVAQILPREGINCEAKERYLVRILLPSRSTAVAALGDVSLFGGLGNMSVQFFSRLSLLVRE